MSKIKIKLFYADWCGHCVHFKPIWEAVKEKYKLSFDFQEESDDVRDATSEKQKYSIKGYPTVVFAKGDKYGHYDGSRDYDSFCDFLNSIINTKSIDDVSTKRADDKAKENLYDKNNDKNNDENNEKFLADIMESISNKNNMILEEEEEIDLDLATRSANKKKQPVLELYYVNWCKYCKEFMPVWDNLQAQWEHLVKKDTLLKKVECVKHNCDKLNKKPDDVKSYPTILLKIGSNKYKFTNLRTIENIINFVKEAVKHYYEQKYIKYKQKYNNIKKIINN